MLSWANCHHRGPSCAPSRTYRRVSTPGVQQLLAQLNGVAGVDRMACTVLGDVFQPGASPDRKAAFTLKTEKQGGDRLELVRRRLCRAVAEGGGAGVVDAWWSVVLADCCAVGLLSAFLASTLHIIILEAAVGTADQGGSNLPPCVSGRCPGLWHWAQPWSRCIGIKPSQFSALSDRRAAGGQPGLCSEAVHAPAGP